MCGYLPDAIRLSHRAFLQLAFRPICCFFVFYNLTACIGRRILVGSSLVIPSPCPYVLNRLRRRSSLPKSPCQIYRLVNVLQLNV